MLSFLNFQAYSSQKEQKKKNLSSLGNFMYELLTTRGKNVIHIIIKLLGCNQVFSLFFSWESNSRLVRCTAAEADNTTSQTCLACAVSKFKIPIICFYAAKMLQMVYIIQIKQKPKVRPYSQHKQVLASTIFVSFN